MLCSGPAIIAAKALTDNDRHKNAYQTVHGRLAREFLRTAGIADGHVWRKRMEEIPTSVVRL